MRKLALLTLLCVALFVPGALAHHPFAADFDSAKPVTLTGTVESFEWTNPHSSIHLKGRDARGPEADWTIELGGVSELTRAGWTKEMLKAGDTITVEGWLAKDGTKRANAKSVKMSSGKSLMAASSFNESDERQLASNNPQGSESAGTSGQLPATATTLPLAGVIGLLSLAAAIGLFAARR